jgi:hypothetical protein
MLKTLCDLCAFVVKFSLVVMATQHVILGQTKKALPENGGGSAF